MSHSSADDLPSSVIAPRQGRSLATLNRLLDAAENLLNERSLEEITVADIVARAGSSVGSFYARFPTKDALVIALLERFHRQMDLAVVELAESEEWTSGDLAGRSRMYIQNVVDVTRRRRGLLRLRLRRRVTPGKIVLPDDKERSSELVDTLRRLFVPVMHEILHPDKDQALAFALRIVDSVVLNTILLDSTSKSFGVIDDEELVSRLVSVFMAYLRGS